MAVGQGISRCKVDDFDPILIVELLKGLTNELWAIIRNNGMRHPKLTYDVIMHKLYELGRLNLHISLDFFPRGEIIHGYQNKFSLLLSKG